MSEQNTVAKNTNLLTLDPEKQTFQRTNVPKTVPKVVCVQLSTNVSHLFLFNLSYVHISYSQDFY